MRGIKMKKICKKVLAVITGATLLWTGVPVHAAEVNNGAVYPVTTNELPGWPQGESTISETAVVMDADTGVILYNKGMDEKRYPASITKIMTALLALEHSSLDEKVVFTEECLAAQAPDSSNIGMQVGEELTMRQCLLALMVKSANDVANQIAVHVAGSIEAFAEMMNQRAQEIGCTGTHFNNPHGLPDENHYTTAHDMALIFQQAIQNESFREIIGTVSFTIEPTNMNPESRTYTNHHSLLLPLSQSVEHYEGCFGGKTGMTAVSQGTLVSGATRDGMTLIAVAMRSEGGGVSYDHINLFNYGFENFKRVEVPGGSVTIPKECDVSQLMVTDTSEGDIIRQDYYYQETIPVGSGVKEKPQPTEAPAVTEEPIPTVEPEAAAPEAGSAADDGKEEIQQKIYQSVIYALSGLIVLGILAICIKKRSQRKKRRRRRKR